MSERRSFDRALHAWLVDEAPAEAPDHILDAVTARRDALEQRRRGSWLMVAAAVLVLLLAGVAGLTLSRIAAPPPDVQPTALPRPTDIPADGSCAPDRQCLGLLAAGEHATTVFSPPLRFTVPAGWQNLEQSGGTFDLRPLDRPGDVIQILALPVPVGADGRAASGIVTADELAALLASRPDLEVTEPASTTVGGHQATMIDVAVRSDAAGLVHDCPAEPCAMLARGLDPRQRPTWTWELTAWEGARQRLYFVGNGPDRLVVAVTAWDATEFPTLIDRAQPILDSLRIGP